MLCVDTLLKVHTEKGKCASCSRSYMGLATNILSQLCWYPLLYVDTIPNVHTVILRGGIHNMMCQITMITSSLINL